MAALLTSVKNHKDNKPLYLNECRRMGIPVLPPDINESGSDFTPRDEEILFGLSAVRGVGEGIVEQIVRARTEKGKFVDFADFCAKVDAGVLNKRTLENLILAGAFGSLGHTRKGLLAVYEAMVDTAQKAKKDEAAGFLSLFGDDGGGEDAVELDAAPEIADDEFDKSQLLKFEREMLGLYVSDHPLFGTERVLDRHVDTSCAGLREKNDNDNVTVGGVLTGLTKKFTRKGDTYLVATLEDLTGNVEVVFWPNTYRAAHEVLLEDEVLVVTGRLEVRDEAIKLQANRVSKPDLSEALGAPILVRFAAEQCTGDAVKRLKDILVHHPGPVAVHLQVDGADGASRTYRLGDELRVERHSGLFGEIKSAFGPQAVDDDAGDRTFGGDDDEPRWRRGRDREPALT
jgi:DNA polymerase-3 subunit alpha